MNKSEDYKKSLLLIDKVNKGDPNKREDGITDAQFYSKKMAEIIHVLSPENPEHIEIAARCQHLCRWEVPRSNFPKGKMGYHQWRRYLYDYQSKKAEDLLRNTGYHENFIQKCSRLIRKEDLGKDEETQLIEDAACITFVKYYLSSFSKDKTKDKLIDILKKTLLKMSDKAIGILVGSELPDDVRDLIDKLD